MFVKKETNIKADKGKRNNRGMATIEAVVIIPLSLTIIMLLIWTGILFYNRNAIDQAASRAAINGGQYSEKSNDELCSIVMDSFAEYINGKTILLNNTEINVCVGYEKISVEVKGNMIFPKQFIFGDIYDSDEWDICIKKESARLRPSIFVRTVSRVENGLDNHAYSQEGDAGSISEGKETL